MGEGPSRFAWVDDFQQVIPFPLFAKSSTGLSLGRT